jgi:hypothetical protein
MEKSVVRVYVWLKWTRQKDANPTGSGSTTLDMSRYNNK